MENIYTDFKLDNETNAWQRQKRIRQNCEKFVFNLYPTLSLLTQALQKCTKKIIKQSCASFCLYQIYIIHRNSRHELSKELEAISNKKQCF